MTNQVQDENLKAFEKLLKQRTIEEEGRLGSFRYYRDLYGNRYGWYVARQKDGKFHAFINKQRSQKNRTFRQKKKAISWCYENWKKHNDRQLNARQSRKEKAEAKKPKLTEQQIIMQKYEKKIQHYEQLINKNNKKIKALVTRQKTYSKRIQYCKKKLDLTKQIQLTS